MIYPYSPFCILLRSFWTIASVLVDEANVASEDGGSETVLRIGSNQYKISQPI